jgi:anti-sigma regulatory factor (Ser/Thr protein kinase)
MTRGRGIKVSGVDETLPVQIRRARQAVAQAVELQARAAQVTTVAAGLVSEIVTRHGDLLRPPAPQIVAGSVPQPAGELLSCVFTGAGVNAARRLVSQVAGAAGLADQILADFVLAVQELMTNTVRHGGGWGRLRLWCDGVLLVCTLTDYGPGFPGEPLGEGQVPPAESAGGRGLLLARSLTDSLHVRARPVGTVVTVTARLPSHRPDTTIEQR